MCKISYTIKDVEDAIEVFLFECEDELVERWVKHPEFKKKILEMANREHLRPYLVITNIWEGSDKTDIEEDLKRWTNKC